MAIHVTSIIKYFKELYKIYKFWSCTFIVATNSGLCMLACIYQGIGFEKKKDNMTSLFEHYLSK